MTDVLERALGEWLAEVRDPARDDLSPDAERCRERIRTYINEGLGKNMPHYAGDGAFKFCGAFVGWCWLAGGLDSAKANAFAGPDVPGSPFGSTYRLLAAAKRCPGFALERFTDIRPTDVVCVKTTGDAAYGDHVVLALAWDKALSELTCVHANGNGRLPSGAWAEGVVVSAYPRAAIRAAYRLDSRWFRG